MGNRLIGGLPKHEQTQLRDALEFVELRHRRLLYDVGERIDDVYFPQNSVVSLVTTLEDGRLIEAATVGNEGMVGLSAFLSAGISQHRTIVQVPDGAWRMSATDFHSVLPRSAGLAAALSRYADALMANIAQSVACMALHTVLQRCARWLLTVEDCTTQPTFRLTQDFLAEMLGCQRPTVSVAAASLQDGGLIHYRRGLITVLDRAGLEAASCECYRAIAARLRTAHAGNG